MILLVVAVLLLLAPPLVAQSQVSIDYAKLREETAQRLSEYIRINTSNPPGNELAAARWLADVIAKEGIRGMILDTAELGPGRANFYARLPGDPGGRGIEPDWAQQVMDDVDVVAFEPDPKSRMGRSGAGAWWNTFPSR